MAWCHLLFETLLVWKFVTQIINSYLFHIQITFSHYIFLFWINETAIPVCFLNFLILSSICEMNPIFLLTFACKVDAYSIRKSVRKLYKTLHQNIALFSILCANILFSLFEIPAQSQLQIWERPGLNLPTLRSLLVS